MKISTSVDLPSMQRSIVVSVNVPVRMEFAFFLLGEKAIIVSRGNLLRVTVAWKSNRNGHTWLETRTTSGHKAWTEFKDDDCVARCGAVGAWLYWAARAANVLGPRNVAAWIRRAF